ncbi:MAG: hypothetical protein KC486_16330 [Myxococcales bacterium]|nr:hypothetical protein [Myxococcales bacterium]
MEPSSMMIRSRALTSLPSLSLLAVGLAVGLGGCTDDPLMSESVTDGPPTSTEPYDPSQGGGTGSTGGTDSGASDTSPTTGGETTGDPMPPMCDDAFKRCPHEFTYPDGGEGSVDVMGDYAADGWTKGRAMESDGSTWRVTIDVPWDAPVQYKLRIDGSDTWIPDPNNPDTVDDGFGGVNSLLDGVTCEWWSCDSGNIGTFDWRDSVIYFVFVDRFNNGDQGNDDPIGVEFEADWQGGDWAGVKAKIDEGYFTDLGINTLWLSVPLDNTNDSGIGVGGDTHQYSAYHGYWPQNFEQTEEHFGTMEELTALIDAAHEQGIKVIVDYAMNHVHSSSSVYADNPGWFWPNDNGQGGNCICGEGCDWDADAKKCWFTGYLPDFKYTDAGARDFSVSNAIWWIEQTGIDGFRLDAVKHIEDSWMLDLRARVKDEIETQTMEHFYMVGETYTGDRDLIKYYVKPEMLDGQFDFPLRMKVAENLIMRQGTMGDLEAFMNTNDGFYGTGIMSTFIGNHDIPRVIHLAEDTPLWGSPWDGGKDKAWEGKPGLPGGMSAFERLATAFTLLLTTPGAPLIYYGDEIGLPGAGDPDNRRFMQWDGYSAGQTFLFDHVSALLAIRADHEATRRGTRKTLSVDADTMAFEMSGGGDTVYVLLNRSDAAKSVGGIPGGSYTDEISGDSVDGPSVMVPARGSRVLVAN